MRYVNTTFVTLFGVFALMLLGGSRSDISVTEMWGYAFFALPFIFWIIDVGYIRLTSFGFVPHKKKIWIIVSGSIWTAIWLLWTVLGTLLTMGIPWVADGRPELRPFLNIFFAAAALNLLSALRFAIAEMIMAIGRRLKALS